jgi:hypothetical protein
MMTTPAQVVAPVIGPSSSPIFRQFKLRSGPLFRPVGATRILLAGWPGSGKTTWLLSWPRTLIIDTIGATEELPPPVHASTKCITISSWEEYRDLLKALRDDAEQNGARRQFDTVAIDELSGLCGSQHSLLAAHMIKDSKSEAIATFGKGGAGWDRLKELSSRFVFLELEALGYGWIGSCHLRRKQVELAVGGHEVRIIRDMIDSIDEMFRNRASFCLKLEKIVSNIPETIIREVAGRSIEIQTGRVTSLPVYTVGVTSATSGTVEELCKGRLLPDLRYQFNAENGHAQFKAAYDLAVEGVKAKVSASSTASAVAA